MSCSPRFIAMLVALIGILGYTNSLLDAPPAMHSQYTKLNQLLDQLCSTLQSLELWSERAPSAEALASQEPFCVDTLSFAEWLQFIFIERMAIMVEQQLPLPTNCGLAPMGEEAFRNRDDIAPLLELLRSIDLTLTH